MRPEVNAAVDFFEGHESEEEFIVPCAIEYYLDDPQIWRFWLNFQYNTAYNPNLDEIPILQAFLIQEFRIDTAITTELERLKAKGG